MASQEETSMKATALYRIASALLLVAAAGNTYGFVNFWRAAGPMSPVHDALRQFDRRNRTPSAGRSHVPRILVSYTCGDSLGSLESRYQKLNSEWRFRFNAWQEAANYILDARQQVCPVAVFSLLPVGTACKAVAPPATEAEPTFLPYYRQTGSDLP
jgi:hypothetical protein